MPSTAGTSTGGGAVLGKPAPLEDFSGFFFLVWDPQASAPITSETHTDRGAVIRKPGSAWLEGTPAMDHRINGKHIHSKK